MGSLSGKIHAGDRVFAIYAHGGSVPDNSGMAKGQALAVSGTCSLVFFILTRPAWLDFWSAYLNLGPGAACFFRPAATWAAAVLWLGALPLWLSSGGVKSPFSFYQIKGKWRLDPYFARGHDGGGFGNFRILFAAGAVSMAASAWWAGQRLDFQGEYPLCRLAFSGLSVSLAYYAGYLVFYAAWEFFFRGFIQLSLAQSLGRYGAMAWQVLLSTLLHWGKPWPEFWGAVPGGIFFGLLALRTRSILAPLALHFELGLLTDIFCARHG